MCHLFSCCLWVFACARRRLRAYHNGYLKLVQIILIINTSCSKPDSTPCNSYPYSSPSFNVRHNCWRAGACCDCRGCSMTRYMAWTRVQVPSEEGAPLSRMKHPMDTEKLHAVPQIALTVCIIGFQKRSSQIKERTEVSFSLGLVSSCVVHFGRRVVDKRRRWRGRHVW